MSLEQREKKFAEMTGQMNCVRPSPLIASFKAPKHLYEKLKLACSYYLLSCLPDNSAVTTKVMAHAGDLLELFHNQKSLLKNMTPNGMLVPKKQLILEYNIMVSAFANIVASMGLGDYIDYWVHPPNLRYKEDSLDENLMKRNYASEYRHTEAWIPLNTNRCVSVFIPVMGDCANNFVEFYEPPRESFTEEWLLPQPSYKSGEAIADRYKPVKVPYAAGNVIVADVATMHATKRNPNSGSRVSFDVNFILKTEDKVRDLRWSSVDQPTYEELLEIGTTRLFVFDDDIDSFVDTAGATVHPTKNRRMIDLKKNQ